LCFFCLLIETLLVINYKNKWIIKKIDLLIVGAGRSGTTSISKYLEEHSQVCFSNIKEVHFFTFADLYKKGDKYLFNFFRHFKNEKIIATADTYAMIDDDAINRVFQYNPKMKIIFILRNPVDRAYSNYIYSINNGYAPHNTSFNDSLIKRIKKHRK
jgi:hypothetical protein